MKAVALALMLFFAAGPVSGAVKKPHRNAGSKRAKAVRRHSNVKKAPKASKIRKMNRNRVN